MPKLRSVTQDAAVLSLLRDSDKLLRDAADYLRPSGHQKLRMALEVALVAHHGQNRRSGEPFITHPVAVAVILAKSNMERDTVVSGLLHDTVEDTELAFEEIERMFGFTVRRIVEGETKVSKLPKMVRSQMAETGHLDEAFAAGAGAKEGAERASKVEEQVENMRSMFIAMADDWRIVVVKLADRLHNMRTLEFMPPHKRASIARETLEIFAPLAHRLGMWQFKTELSDLSFKYLFPAEYEQLDRQISSKFVECQAVLAEAQQQMEEMLQLDPWLQGRLRSVQVVGRTKSIYSTFKKMERHECGIERIYDLVALRVVLKPEEEMAGLEEEEEDVERRRTEEEAGLCYHVLGKVHSQYTPLPRTLKDYISSPKPNGYRSLHTTVLVGTQPLEVQIRTTSMHHIAEYGAAAHWAYRDRAAPLPWLQIIREWQDNVESADEFMQLVREELLGTRVFVFTRNGRILNLAKGATMMDAAKHLNKNECGYVPMLNGKAALHTQPLVNGDIVAFERSSGILLDRIAEQGQGPGQLQQHQPPWGEEDAGQGISEYAKYMAQRAASGTDSPVPEVPSLGESMKQRAREYLEARGPKPEGGGRVGWSPCSECLPLPGDDLFGASFESAAEARGGTVHSDRDCRTLRSQVEGGFHIVESNERAFTEMLRSHSERARGLSASIIVFCTDRRGMLIDVATAVTEGAENIINVHSDVFVTGGKSAFKYEVMVRDSEQLQQLIDAVSSVPDVTKVIRSKHYK